MAHDQGRFVWFECITKDVKKAKAFYTEVFGWKVEPMEMAGGKTYDLLKKGDTPLGGFMEPMMEGVPSHWMSYLSVDDVDASLAKVEQAGGKSLVKAFDVPGVGRIAPVQDSEGGSFCLFHSANGDSNAATGPGSFHWNELWTSDAGKSLAFYKKAFGYSSEEMPMPTGKYYVLKNGDKPRGGLMKSMQEGIPTMWLPYVQVDGCDDTVKRAKNHGAEVHLEATDVPNVGRFAILKDPLGAVIGVITPAN